MGRGCGGGGGGGFFFFNDPATTEIYTLSLHDALPISSLETTERTLAAASQIARGLPEVTAIEAYAGTASPFNFNGLVRHYFLRSRPEMGDLAITLAHKSDRRRTSHAVALDLREQLAALPLPTGASLKVVEAPPGPPVMATLLAEIYGPAARPEERRVG